MSNKESAGLLLFRLLYYIIPFALSLVILGLREILLAISASRTRERPPYDPPPSP